MRWELFACHGWYHLSCWSLGVGASRWVKFSVRRRPHRVSFGLGFSCLPCSVLVWCGLLFYVQAAWLSVLRSWQVSSTAGFPNVRRWGLWSWLLRGIGSSLGLCWGWGLRVRWSLTIGPPTAYCTGIPVACCARSVAVDPLWVCDLEKLGDELFSPIGAVEKVVGHWEMEPLNIVEVWGYVPLCKVPPANFVLTFCEGVHFFGHIS